MKTGQLKDSKQCVDKILDCTAGLDSNMLSRLGQLLPYQGMTALVLAAGGGKVECLKELLAAGAEKAPCTLCWVFPEVSCHEPGSFGFESCGIC